MRIPYPIVGLAVACILPGLGHAQVRFGPQHPISRVGDVGQVDFFIARDLNGDGRADVAMSGDSLTALYLQRPEESGYGPPVLLSGSRAARQILPVDLDGDGDLDLIALYDFEVGWYRNAGPADGFEPLAGLAVSWPELDRISVADLDLDGDPDLLASGSGIGWYENLGGGVLAPNAILIAAEREVLTDVADVDGDGDPDLLTRTTQPSSARIAFGWRENLDGLGSFGPPSEVYSVSLGMQGDLESSAFLADLDGDSDSDVLVATNICPIGCSYALGWYVNTTGRGDFGTGEDIDAGVGTIVVHPSDVDGDGDVDLLAGTAAGESGTLAFYESRGGDFGDPHLVAEDATARPILGASDADGDGVLDFFATYPGRGAVSLFIRTGDSSLFGPAQPVTAVAETDGPRSLYLGDLDGDGSEDVLVASGEDDKISWFRNVAGTGSFGAQAVISSTTDGASAAVASDLDGDEDLDVLAAASRDGTIVWHRNAGTGEFGLPNVVTSLAIGVCWLTTADVDSDGDLDIMAAGSGSQIWWYRNINGGGAFGPQLTVTDAAGPLCAADMTHPAEVVDLDGDGDPDVLSAGQGPALVWYPNGGTGGFGEARLITLAQADIGSGITSIRSTDVDADGDLDVVWSTRDGDDNLRLRRNDGTGAFSATEVLGSVGQAGLVGVPADIDRDGDRDLIVAVGGSAAGSVGEGIAWLENIDGTGAFSQAHIAAEATNGIQSVVVGDLDGDGDADLVSASVNDDRVAWYENLLTGLTAGTRVRASDITTFTVHPNPGSERIMVTFEAAVQQSVSIELYDLLGRRHSLKDIGVVPMGPARVPIDTSDLSAGIYLCRLTAGGSVATRMLVVQ